MASRPLSSLQMLAVAEARQRLSVRRTAAQQKLVPTAKKREENWIMQLFVLICCLSIKTCKLHWMFDLHEDDQIKTAFSSHYPYLSLNNVIHHIRIRWQIHKDFRSLNLKHKYWKCFIHSYCIHSSAGLICFPTSTANVSVHYNHHIRI